MNHQKPGSGKSIKLIVIVAICSILVVAVMLLPKGFKDDLSLIGHGSVSVVLTHDKNLVDSTTMMELLNKVRSDYKDNVEFLAVDIATPTGQTFLREQNVGVINLVIFSPDGSRKRVVNGRIGEQELRSILDDVL